MSHDDEAGEELLAGVDLHKWRVPAPSPGRRDTILVRALAPAAAPRRRLGWLVAGMLLLNAVIVTLIVIVIPRPTEQRVIVRAAGGTSDADVQELLRRLDAEREELERRLAEIEQLRTLANELAEKLRRFEEREKRERTIPRKRDAMPAPAPAPIPAPAPAPAPPPAPTASLGCDEVSCVLTNYGGTCCAKYRAPVPAPLPSNGLDETLDRAAISEGVASVKARVQSCGDHSSARGKVKANVVVGPNGKVTRVTIATTPDSALGACVASAMQSARFRTTKLGGSFSYPFVF